MATSPLPIASPPSAPPTTRNPTPSPTSSPSPLPSPSFSSSPVPYAGPHVVLSLPRCTWKKGSIAEYVSKARVFFDSLHEGITLFTGSPVNKAWTSDKQSGTWKDYPVDLPPQNDILGAQLSPDKTMLAIRVSDKEVKVLSTSTGEVLTARSCRPPTRMISVHWLSTELTLLFITNAGIELYSLIRGRLKHIKTAPYNIVYHWVLLSDSLLLLVDNKSMFQIFQLSSKALVKVCKFELDCVAEGTLCTLADGTSVLIEEVQVGMRVLARHTADKELDEGLTPLTVTAVLDRGVRECVELLFSDGRTLICTDNHRILTAKGQWVQAGQLVVGESEVSVEAMGKENVNKTTHGGISKESQMLRPLFSVTLVDRREVGPHHVYDLSVPSPQGEDCDSFVANGICVHNCKNTSLTPPVNGQSFHRDQISLLNVYGRMVVCFINEAKAQLHLLSLLPSSDEMEQTHVFDLYQPGKYELSCIDDVIVVHQSVHKVSLLFDIRTDSKSAITDPLAVGSALSDERRVNFYSPDELFQVPNPDKGFEAYKKWTFLSPRYVWESIGDQQQGHFWTLSLNNEAIALSWPVSKRAKLIDMLMKRSTPDAKLIVLQLILQLICTEPSQLSLLSRIFSMIQRITYDHRLPSPSSSTSLQSSSSFSAPRINTSIHSPSSPRHKNSSSSPRFTRQRSETATSFSSSSSSSSPIWDLDADASLECERMDVDDGSTPSSASAVSVEQNLNGYMLISQLDVFTFVFLPARRHLPPREVIPAVIEFLRSIYRHRLRVEDYINDLLVSLLLADRQYYQLHQFLQYHLLIDSLPIANRLIDLSSQYEAAYQLGLDMLHRLGAKSRLVQVLLGRHQVLPALKLVTHKSPLFDREGLQVRDWLKAAKAHGDPLVFFTTFRWMEARNLTIRNTNVFYASDKCDEFVLHYTCLFGAQHRLNPPASHKEVVLTAEAKAEAVHPLSGLGVEELRRKYAVEEGDDWDEWSESDWLDNADEISAMGAAQAAHLAQQEEAAAAMRKQMAEERMRNQPQPIEAPAHNEAEAEAEPEAVQAHEEDGEEEEVEVEEEVEEEEAEEVDPQAGDTDVEENDQQGTQEEEEEEDEEGMDEVEVEVEEEEEEEEEEEMYAAAAAAGDGLRVEDVEVQDQSPHPQPSNEDDATPRQFDDGEEEEEEEEEVEVEVDEDEEEEEQEEEEVVAGARPSHAANGPPVTGLGKGERGSAPHSNGSHENGQDAGRKSGQRR